MAQLLLASNEVEIILPPPRANANGLSFSATVRQRAEAEPLEQAQKQLRGRPPLTFENLSWPSEDELSGDTGDLYRGSAQLFVGELLRLPDGRACLRAMLAQLPQHYNWQFAFLQRLSAPFSSARWMSRNGGLCLSRRPPDATSRKPGRVEESWQKLDSGDSLSVQVRTGTNELPLHAEIACRRSSANGTPCARLRRSTAR